MKVCELWQLLLLDLIKPKTMKIPFLILILFLSQLLSAQFSIETVKVTETLENENTSEIPKLVSEKQDDFYVLKKVNDYILKEFMVSSFEQQEIKSFRWYDATFKSEIKDSILYISYAGEYIGGGINDIENELFFDLKTGERLENYDIPFQGLFTIQGYLDFMNSYWLPKAKNAFKEALNCTDSEPDGTIYEISDYKLDNGIVSIAMNQIFHKRYDYTCDPLFSATVTVEELLPLLSDKGKLILLTDNYTQKSKVETYLYNEEMRPTLPTNIYLWGQIDNKMPFTMGLNINNESNEVAGIYFYDKIGKNIQLKGTKDDDTFYLEEFYEGKMSGKININSRNPYLPEGFGMFLENSEIYNFLGDWSSPNGDKKLELIFDAITFSHINNY